MLNNIHPIIVSLLRDRGLKSEKEMEEFLFPDYAKNIPDPFLFSQMEKAVQRIGQARKKKEKVVVFGDYDADGVTSSVILEETLSVLGISAKVYIPDKNKEGYGMNLPALEKFQTEGINLIITVDCGISNATEIKKATELGIDVIVTDHHHIPKTLPRAVALINPKMKNSGYPFSELAGVGVAFKLAQALLQKFLPEKNDQTKWFLDLVAIGTVADCVPLLGENRVLAKYGLVVLSKTRRVGLQEIFKTGRVLIDENNFPNSQKISFAIAPRINAAGRIDHADLAYGLLMEKDRLKARGLALELEAKNQKRQKDTEQIVNEITKIAKNSFKDKKFIFVSGEHFPLGIVGLAAGKIADKFSVPAAVFQKGETESKGSFRSVDGLNIIEIIEKCGDLLEKFGGHSQAAGATIRNENLEKFYQKMNQLIETEMKKIPLVKETKFDREISFGDIGFELAHDILKMEPFGEGNEKPSFLTKNFIVQEIRLVGNGEKHLKLFLRPNDGTPRVFEAIGFSLAEKFADLKPADKIDLIYRLGIDQWNGSEKLSLEIVDLKPQKG